MEKETGRTQGVKARPVAAGEIRRPPRRGCRTSRQARCRGIQVPAISRSARAAFFIFAEARVRVGRFASVSARSTMNAWFTGAGQGGRRRVLLAPRVDAVGARDGEGDSRSVSRNYPMHQLHKSSALPGSRSPSAMPFRQGETAWQRVAAPLEVNHAEAAPMIGAKSRVRLALAPTRVLT